MKHRVSVAVLSVALTVSAGTQGDVPHSDSIRAADLRADLYFLASDDMRGRLTGTLGNHLAAEFIKARFERLGLLAPAPDDSFFQTFRLTTAALGEGNEIVAHGGTDGERRFQVGRDFYPFRSSPTARARGSVVFAGFGISAPGLGYDDYRAADVAGRIVLALDHEPGEHDASSPFDGRVMSAYANPLAKARTAQERGAVALLVVTDVHNHERTSFDATARRYWPERPPRVDRYILTDWIDEIRIPIARVSEATADRLLERTDRSIRDLAQAVEAGPAAPLRVAQSDLELSVDVTRRTIVERNVIAKIEGGDPAASGECVIICAHFDHDGVTGDEVFNGADDNGSGTVALMDIAEAYALAARDGQRPRRSVLFAALNAEERGLLGSWAYTENPIVPLDRTVAVFNLDMVGRNEEVPQSGGSRFRGLDAQTATSNENSVNLIGYSRSHELASLVEAANSAIGLDLKLRYDDNISNLLRRSDHWPFIERGVPAVWIHTGLHPDYHTVDDDPDKINYAKMEQIAKLVHRASWMVADR